MIEHRQSAYWVHVVASVLMNEFEEYGFASDYAWQELFDNIEDWRDGKIKKKDLIALAKFTFGLDEKKLDNAIAEADQHLKELEL